MPPEEVNEIAPPRQEFPPVIFTTGKSDIVIVCVTVSVQASESPAIKVIVYVPAVAYV
jgi:hypothetical protein